MKVNIGVIGVGSISDMHIQAYVKNKHVKLLAFCDLQEERLAQKGKLYGVDQLYTSYKDLLANDEIDAVSICTWNDSHAEIAIAALEAGKDVLVEKPLSMTVEEALAVEEAVRRTNKILQVGFVRRHADNAQVLKRFIDHGELGEIYYAKASLLRRLGNPGGWFSDLSKSGGGPLIDLGVHMIDLSWYLMGKPKAVSVSGNTYQKLGNRSHIENLSFYQAADYDPSRNEVEDLANALIRFENGASLFVDVSFSLHLKEEETKLQLFGDQGGAEIEPELKIVTERHQTILNLTPQMDHRGFHFEKSFTNEINHFVASVLGKEQSIAPVEDGVEMMKILRAVYESARLGKEIYL